MLTDTISDIRLAVVIPAAGIGSRMSSPIPKQYHRIQGKPILLLTLQKFLQIDSIQSIVVALHPDDVWFTAMIEEFAIVAPTLSTVIGGLNRQDSVSNAIATLNSEIDLVLIHDAVRPFISRQLVNSVVAATIQYGAALPGVPIPETVKVLSSAGVIEQTINRENLRLAQTPQGFHLAPYKEALSQVIKNDTVCTDDASVYEKTGLVVHVIPGDPMNIKITTPSDLFLAEHIISHFQ